jgi:uncharacterized membrane protein YfcA
MKPSERFQAYVAGGFGILVACGFGILFSSFAFLPSSWFHKWIEDPGELRFVGWFTITGLCCAATGAIRGWAARRRNNWLLLLAVPPAAVLAYVTWFILTRLSASLWADLKPIWHANNWFPFVLCSLALYLWIRGNKYKERAERCKTQLEIAWEAINKQSRRCPHCGAQL